MATNSISVQLRFFASLREALGPAQVVELAAGSTVGALRDQLIARGGAYAELLSRQRAVRAAVAQQMAGEDAILNDGAEVAFFPPVTGG